MTGIELLQEQLLEKGFTKTQVTAKVVGGVLDVLAETGCDVYRDVCEAQQKLSHIKNEIEGEKRRLDSERKRQQERFMIQSLQFERMVENEKAYIEKFFCALNNCETDEGRDRLRAAQMFVNSVSIDSKYDNTAYIIGLSAILSDGKIGALQELKKMNPKMFECVEVFRR